MILNREELRRKIRKIRKAIRSHRDAKGDDRCWLDDYRVWGSITGSSWPPMRLPPDEEMRTKCREFWTHRRAEKADEAPVDMIVSKHFWNADLIGLGSKELQGKLRQLEEAIAKHRDIVGRPTTLDDDRALYTVLPEKLPADFRLPSEQEFLGEALAPHAGCPAFWQSHQNCPSRVSGCNIYQWGPCGK